MVGDAQNPSNLQSATRPMRLAPSTQTIPCQSLKRPPGTVRPEWHSYCFEGDGESAVIRSFRAVPNLELNSSNRR